jgi:hypothetical protein
MCLLCARLSPETHFTEYRFDASVTGGTQPGHVFRRDRRDRIRLVNTVTRQYGLNFRSDLGGVDYVLDNGKGAVYIVQHLGQLWPEAERLAGRPLDPLDPSLLEHLENLAGKPR